MTNHLIFTNVQHTIVVVTCLRARTLFMRMKFACSQHKTKQLTQNAFQPS